MGIIVAVFFFSLNSFLKITVCQEGVCNIKWNVTECCIDYRRVNNKCVLCQTGFYGLGCKTPCPDRFYGEACREECNCEDDQICDPIAGCVYNVTEATTIQTYTDSFSVSTTIETTPDEYPETQEMTTELNEDSINDIPLQYMYATPLGIVLILLVAIALVQCREKRVPLRMSNDDVGALAVNFQVALPVHPFDQIEDGSASEYAEIRECHAIYSDANEVSGIYNELSFSKSKAMRRLNEPVNAMYDTSQSCIMHNEVAAADEPQGHLLNNRDTDAKLAVDM